MSKNTDPSDQGKPGMHPRNRYRHGYPFEQLAQKSPELQAYLRTNDAGRPSIDYADADAVLALNRALLVDAYKLKNWSIPEGYLCPPVPGRSDIIHHAADLLASSHPKGLNKGASIRVLDVGVGANAILPIIGIYEYGWTFVGADIDLPALHSVEKLMESNDTLHSHLSLRLQTKPAQTFKEIIMKDEFFDLTLCNPPFYRSAEEAARVSLGKFRNLGKREPERNMRNFGGQHRELWVEGGELQFVASMIRESRFFDRHVLWFTSMVSKKEHLPELYKVFDEVEAVLIRTIPMSQGLKSSRMIAWSFLKAEEHRIWTDYRWQK
jgi:23S rRNA (adenine1618-N6)-methyltransferase